MLEILYTPVSFYWYRNYGSLKHVPYECEYLTRAKLKNMDQKINKKEKAFESICKTAKLI